MNNEVIVTCNELVAQAKMDANIYLNMNKTIDSRSPYTFDGFINQLSDTWTSIKAPRHSNHTITLVNQAVCNTVFAHLSSNQEQLPITKTHPKAQLPYQATEGSAGFDIASVENITIPPHSRSGVSTGLIFNFPPNLYGEIKRRRGLAKHKNVTVHNGIIDSGF